MTKDELIAKQQLEIETMKETIKLHYESFLSIDGELHGIGGPLNDNYHQYTHKQLMPFLRIREQICLPDRN